MILPLLLPWNISKSSGIDWMEIELVNILFSVLQLSTWCQCSRILPSFWFPISSRAGSSLFFFFLPLTSVLRSLSPSECIMLRFKSSCCAHWPRNYRGKGFARSQGCFFFVPAQTSCRKTSFLGWGGAFVLLSWQLCCCNTQREFAKWINISLY